MEWESQNSGCDLTGPVQTVIGSQILASLGTLGQEDVGLHTPAPPVL